MFRSSVPKRVLPTDDRIDFVQEEPPVLQAYPNSHVFDWLVIVVILAGSLSPVIAAIWELPTCALECARILCRLLLLSYERGWRLYPEKFASAICEADARVR